MKATELTQGARICLLLLGLVTSASASRSDLASREGEDFDNSIPSIIGDNFAELSAQGARQNPAVGRRQAQQSAEVRTVPTYREILPQTTPQPRQRTRSNTTGSYPNSATTEQDSTTDGRRILGIKGVMTLEDLIKLAQKQAAEKAAAEKAAAEKEAAEKAKTHVPTAGSDTTTFAYNQNHEVTETATRQADANETQSGQPEADRNRMFAISLQTTIATPKNTSRDTPSTARARYTRRMCGYPPICDQDKCQRLNISEDSLENCEIPGAKAGLVFAVATIALAIIVGNLMLPFLVWRSRDMRAPHNLMKVSLAFADVIIGFVLLFSTIPNMMRTMRSTESEVLRMMEETTNSPQAIVAGSMLTLSAQASLFHLTYLSIERFVAIRWPLWHRFKAPGSLCAQVTLIWGLSIVAALLPAAFPDTFTFQYVPVLSVYILANANPNHTALGSVVYVLITMALPFLISVILTAATGVVVWRKMKSTSQMRNYSTRNSMWTRTVTESGEDVSSIRGTKPGSERSPKELKPEVRVFKTTVVMISAFCITLLPFIVVFLLYYNGHLECQTYSVPYASAFYACASNSFVNVLIYTARDRKFRATWKKILGLSKRARWPSAWRSQRTKASACASTTKSSRQAGVFTSNTESVQDNSEKMCGRK